MTRRFSAGEKQQQKQKQKQNQQQMGGDHLAAGMPPGQPIWRSALRFSATCEKCRPGWGTRICWRAENGQRQKQPQIFDCVRQGGLRAG
jgi:hypothetical protein